MIKTILWSGMIYILNTYMMKLILLIILSNSLMAVKPISICCHNVRGFNGSVPYLRQLTKEYDVVAISEHWLHENKLSRLSDISNDVHVCARASKYASAENYGVARGQGGIALLWKNSLGNTTSINDNYKRQGVRYTLRNKKWCYH